MSSTAGEWSRYAKLLTASPTQVMEIITAEREAVQQQLTRLDSSEVGMVLPVH